MYLSNPNLISGTMKDYISYTFSGKDIDTPLNRRFSDFLALRQKLVERWPGIFIPVIPPKKAINNNDERTINKRLRMLNRFLFKISNMSFLNYSDEIKKFKTVQDIQKELESMKKPSYLEIYERYEVVFNEKKENYDLSIGKTKVNDFLVFLKKIHKSVSNFYDKYKNMFIKKQTEKNLYLEVIKNFQEFEKKNIKGYTDEDDNKLVFYNVKNYDLFNRLIKLKDALFDVSQPLYEFFQDERLDIEGLIEALEGINKLIETHSKSIEKLENIKKELNSGNIKGIKNIFKNKDQVTGQTPFSPATILFLQLHERLKQLKAEGGEAKNIADVRHRCEVFRALCKQYGWEIPAEVPSQDITGFQTRDTAERIIFRGLIDKYDTYIMPGGIPGFYRVSHMGLQTDEELRELAARIHEFEPR